MASIFMLKTFLRTTATLLLVTLMIACGNTQKVQQSPILVEASVSQQYSEINTPLSFLNKARIADDPYVDLINLIELIAKQDCVKSLKIAELLSEELRSNDLKSKGLLQRFDLAVASCHFQLSDHIIAQEILLNIEDSPGSLVQKYTMLYEIALLNENWWQAANAWYLISERNFDADVKIWKMLQRLDTESLLQHHNEISSLAPLVELILIQRNLTYDPASAKKGFEKWATKFPNQSFASQWPESIVRALATNTTYMNVAVLLPLSGQRKTQGAAIKEGILNANFSNPKIDRELTFIDTNRWQISPPESFEGYDLIIGPLLKENIELVAPLVPETTKILSLNRVDAPIINGNWFYYSLAPEDEALQLAKYLIQQGIKKPMLVVSEGSAYKRMENVFSRVWAEILGEPPVVLNFSGNKQLRNEVNDKLSLTESKARIRKIKSLLKPEVHSFERNRRDVDVIVVLANATQTELINPLIEASISPFADIIPVYGTSRSHSKLVSANGFRDLRNLFVLDMPWMLKTPQYAWLQQQNKTLWPDRRDTQNRLFALGYDAFNLASVLEFLAYLPNQTWQGMTGKLVLDDKNQINRTSLFAQYSQQDILPVEAN